VARAPPAIPDDLGPGADPSFGIASGCEALAAAAGWNEPLYRTWYLTGAFWTAGWLGLRDGVPAGRKPRFGYAFAFSLFLAGALHHS